MKYIFSAILLIMALGVGAGMGYFLDDGAEDTEEMGGGVIVDNKEPIVVGSDGQLVDCGRAVFDPAEIKGGVLEIAATIDLQAGDEIACFNARFKSCSPTVFVEGMKGMTIAKYQIIGSVDEGCEAEISYVSHTVASLVGPKMTCVRDTNDLFDRLGFEGCSGELYDLMDNLGF